MRRREFFSFAAATAVAAPSIAQSNGAAQSTIEQIGEIVRRELPDIKSLEITYDPEDSRVPLMILAFRI
ncbi:hypothetical protein CN204_04345 [Sinorhizobium meliloti]|uniref:hypothetical protein n=1 Tax=Rhizobium meliloti TaxID=382 RepID=UPI000FD907F2|nr:hypothetical protein [Sinorhizobium meliloti]RVH87766.1 hypothetical protein CN204_04345 [Sinorhizobium meliloti]